LPFLKTRIKIYYLRVTKSGRFKNSLLSLLDMLELVPQKDQSIEVRRGKRLEERLDFPIAKQKVSEGWINLQVVGSYDFLYDQIATTPEGTLTILDCIKIWHHDPYLPHRGKAQYNQRFPMVRGVDLKYTDFSIGEFAGQGIRLHEIRHESTLFAYDIEDGSLLGVFAVTPIVANMDMSDRSKPVRNRQAIVNTGLTAPTYTVTLPEYEHDRTYVDILQYNVDQIIGGDKLDNIDSGVRDSMREHGVGSMSMMAFYTPDMQLYKQVIVYHKDVPSFARIDLPLICDSLREEFFMGNSQIGEQKKADVKYKIIKNYLLKRFIFIIFQTLELQFFQDS